MNFSKNAFISVCIFILCAGIYSCNYVSEQQEKVSTAQKITNEPNDISFFSRTFLEESTLFIYLESLTILSWEAKHVLKKGDGSFIVDYEPLDYGNCFFLSNMRVEYGSSGSITGEMLPSDSLSWTFDITNGSHTDKMIAGGTLIFPIIPLTYVG